MQACEVNRYGSSTKINTVRVDQTVSKLPTSNNNCQHFSDFAFNKKKAKKTSDSYLRASQMIANWLQI